MKKVFISYSRDDEALVKAVVRLLRALGSFIFFDQDTIPPGKKWRDVLDKALANAQILIVFWCLHSNESEEVTKEWKKAIELGKDVMPVLLDSTPLPDELGHYQYIDFRHSFKGHRSNLNHEIGEPPGANTGEIRESNNNAYSEKNLSGWSRNRYETTLGQSGATRSSTIFRRYRSLLTWLSLTLMSIAIGMAFSLLFSSPFITDQLEIMSPWAQSMISHIPALLYSAIVTLWIFYSITMGLRGVYKQIGKQGLEDRTHRTGRRLPRYREAQIEEVFAFRLHRELTRRLSS